MNQSKKKKSSANVAFNSYERREKSVENLTFSTLLEIE